MTCQYQASRTLAQGGDQVCLVAEAGYRQYLGAKTEPGEPLGELFDHLQIALVERRQG